MLYYHVDRYNQLNKLETIYPYAVVKENPIFKFFTYLSSHGAFYLNRDVKHPASVMNELILEYVREHFFSNRTSRFQSFFASVTKEQALEWAKYFKKYGKDINDKYNIKKYNIVTIESTNAFIGDAAWFSKLEDIETNLHFFSSLSNIVEPNSVAEKIEAAFKYWNGEFTNNPLPEVLIPLPFTINSIEVISLDSL